jgi:hypothetical protein
MKLSIKKVMARTRRLAALVRKLNDAKTDAQRAKAREAIRQHRRREALALLPPELRSLLTRGERLRHELRKGKGSER